MTPDFRPQPRPQQQRDSKSVRGDDDARIDEASMASFPASDPPAFWGGREPQGDGDLVDRHLVAVVNEVLDAVYQAKQVAWSASNSPARPHLQDLVAFLIHQSGQFMDAEQSIGGRSTEVSSPSSHQRGNLLQEANGDVATAVTLLARRLQAVVDDVRVRAAALSEAKEAPMLIDLADGLEARVSQLGLSW